MSKTPETVLEGHKFRLIDPELDAAPEAKHYETVDHPQHYNLHPSGIECIDVIEFMPYNIGTAMKYLWRAGLKPGASTREDLEKAVWHATRQMTIGDRVNR